MLFEPFVEGGWSWGRNAMHRNSVSLFVTRSALFMRGKWKSKNKKYTPQQMRKVTMTRMDTQSAFILAFFISASRFSAVELLNELTRLQFVDATIPVPKAQRGKMKKKILQSNYITRKREIIYTRKCTFEWDGNWICVAKNKDLWPLCVCEITSDHTSWKRLSSCNSRLICLCVRCFS